MPIVNTASFADPRSRSTYFYGSNADILTAGDALIFKCLRGENVSLYFVFLRRQAKKEAHRSAPLCPGLDGCQAALTLRAAASSAAASLPRMNARRIGLITNSAIKAAVALSATAITNTACQP
ncbi:hypothetical protein V1289_008185 [Bradyrhizobium sp. AZCC 2289]